MTDRQKEASQVGQHGETWRPVCEQLMDNLRQFCMYNWPHSLRLDWMQMRLLCLALPSSASPKLCHGQNVFVQFKWYLQQITGRNRWAFVQDRGAGPTDWPPSVWHWRDLPSNGMVTMQKIATDMVSNAFSNVFSYLVWGCSAERLAGEACQLWRRNDLLGWALLTRRQTVVWQWIVCCLYSAFNTVNDFPKCTQIIITSKSKPICRNFDRWLKCAERTIELANKTLWLLQISQWYVSSDGFSSDSP